MINYLFFSYGLVLDFIIRFYFKIKFSLEKILHTFVPDIFRVLGVGMVYSKNLTRTQLDNPGLRLISNPLCLNTRVSDSA